MPRLAKPTANGAAQLRETERLILDGNELPTVTDADMRALVESEPGVDSKAEKEFPCWGCMPEKPCSNCQLRRRYSC